MPRTVVYDQPVVQVEMEKELDAPRQARKPTGPPAAKRRAARRKATQAGTDEKAAAADSPIKDDYASKLAKYVPGEVVAVSIAGFAAFDPTGNWVWLGIALGIGATILYLAGTAERLPVAARPRPYFYILSGVAFVFWAMGTIPHVRAKFGLEGDDNADKAAWLLLAAAFVIPLLDTLADGLEVRRNT